MKCPPKSNVLGAVMISDLNYMIIAAIIFTIKLLLQHLRDFGKKCYAKYESLKI